MSTSAASLGVLTANLRNSQSFHPTLSLSLPSSPSITLPTRSSCEANVLLHLPPGLFYDPYTAGSAIVGGSGARGRVISSAGLELEQAVGWVRRKAGQSEAGSGGRQWWERKDAESEAVDLHGILDSVLRETAQEAVSLSLDGVRINIDKEERSTVVIPIDMDALLNGPDAFRIDIPLHARYHAPTTSKASLGSSLSTLLHDIAPSATTAHYNRQQHSQYAIATVPPPTIYIACARDGRPDEVTFPSSHAHLKAQFRRVAAEGKVVAQTKGGGGGLKVRVPVPMDALRAAVQWVTLVTVVGAAGGVGWRLWRVLGWLDEVEKGW